MSSGNGNSNQHVGLTGNVLNLNNSTVKIITSANPGSQDHDREHSVNARNNAGDSALRWVRCSGKDPLPPRAILAGEDLDGHKQYVGRAYHEENQLPAKVVPKKEYAYVSNVGQVIRKESFEVLCGGSVRWVQPEYGSGIPAKAIAGGRTASGELLYIGRGDTPHGKQMMGKIVPQQGTLYIPYGGSEHATRLYEVLVED